VVKKRLGCLHAHFSNIDYIEKAFFSYNIELIHFVDPALIYRVSNDQYFGDSDARNKVKEQIEWIAQCNVDAILITCTNYIALLEEEQLRISIPIIKIDEPFFDYLLSIEGPQTILFTNPSTIEGTMDRLKRHASNYQKEIEIDVMVINNTFKLLMEGLIDEYNQEIIKFLKRINCDENGAVSVAQLSMVYASEQFNSSIIHPLLPLVSSIVNRLKLEKKIESSKVNLKV